MPDRAPGVKGATGGRGLDPGPPPATFRDALERDLATGLAAIERITEQRELLDRNLADWRAFVSAVRKQLKNLNRRPRDIDQLQLSFPAAPAGGSALASTASVERFSKFVVPVAERLISELGRPVTIDEIYRSLPSELRDELDKVPSAYSAQFRIRRMLRRNKRFSVTRTGIDIHQRLADTKTRFVTGLVTRMGSTVAFQVQDGNDLEYMTPLDVASAMAAGARFLVRSPDGGNSELGLVETEFYSHKDDKETDDYFKLPHINVNELPSIALEDGSDLGDE